MTDHEYAELEMNLWRGGGTGSTNGYGWKVDRWARAPMKRVEWNRTRFLNDFFILANQVLEEL